MLGPLHFAGPVASELVGGPLPPVQVPERQRRLKVLVAVSNLKASMPPPCAGAMISARLSPSRSATATDDGAITASPLSFMLYCCAQSEPQTMRRMPGLP